MAKEQQLQTSNFTKLEGFIKEIVERFVTDWPKIIGQGTNIVLQRFECLLFNDFKRIINDKTLLLEFNMSGERSGNLFLKFPYRDAAIISGSILMEEEDEIKKNLEAPEMSEDYLDAFGEFGNQTAACFETIYRNHFPDDDDNHVRFIQTYPAPIDAGDINKIFSAEEDDEVLITHLQCSIWSFDKGDIDLLIVSDVAEGMFNELVTASTKKPFANLVYVDNKKEDISFIKKILRNSGYSVHVCNDSETAIAKLQHEKVDMVIIDTNFGELDDDEGLSLCLRIKRNMLLDNIPIVMTAIHATKKLVLDCVRIGATDFLVKPFNKEMLFCKLDKLIKRKKLAK